MRPGLAEIVQFEADRMRRTANSCSKDLPDSAATCDESIAMFIKMKATRSLFFIITQQLLKILALLAFASEGESNNVDRVGHQTNHNFRVNRFNTID